MNFLKEYSIVLIIFLAIDALWLGFIAKNLYANMLKDFLSDKPNFIAALIFYLIFVVGIVFFVVNPGLEKNDLMYVITAGILFGAISYATYDLTNLATLKNWPVIVTVIDIAWGAFLTTAVSVISFFILK